MPAAGDSSLFSSACNGPEHFLRVAPRRGLRPDYGHAPRSRTQAGGPLTDPDRGGTNTQLVKTTDSCCPSGCDAGQEGRRAQASSRRRCRKYISLKDIIPIYELYGLQNKIPESATFENSVVNVTNGCARGGIGVLVQSSRHRRFFV